jgi:hypothetical protein
MLLHDHLDPHTDLHRVANSHGHVSHLRPDVAMEGLLPLL